MKQSSVSAREPIILDAANVALIEDAGCGAKAELAMRYNSTRMTRRSSWGRYT